MECSHWCLGMWSKNQGDRKEQVETQESAPVDKIANPGGMAETGAILRNLMEGGGLHYALIQIIYTVSAKIRWIFMYGGRPPKTYSNHCPNCGC